MLKVIIAGGRDFDDYELLSRKCDSILKNIESVEIVSGCARGADKLGEIYAKNKGIPLKTFPADWDKYKKRAGILRNIEMSEYADALIAFFDGSSAGTKHMVETAKEKGLKVRVIKYTNRSVG